MGQTNVDQHISSGFPSVLELRLTRPKKNRKLKITTFKINKVQNELRHKLELGFDQKTNTEVIN
jgi:hypothetical protein